MGVVTRTRIKARNVRIDSLLCEARLPGPRNPQYPASVKTVRRLDAKCVNYADTLGRPESVGVRSDTVLLQERQNLMMPLACTQAFGAADRFRVHVLRRYESMSDHTASSLPFGSAKWNRRPPGNEKIFLTIFPPAASIFF